MKQCDDGWSVSEVWADSFHIRVGDLVAWVFPVYDGADVVRVIVDQTAQSAFATARRIYARDYENVARAKRVAQAVIFHHRGLHR